MRHGKKNNHLSRKAGHRRALLMNMSNALIQNKRINTTLAKAKALRRYVEPLITKAKKNTTHSRRVVFSYLQDKEAVNELFGPIATAVMDRPGGYTRVIRLGFRPSDGAELAMIELVDFNEVYTNPSKSGSEGGGRRKRRRTRRGGGGSSSSQAASTAATLPDSAEETSGDTTAGSEEE